MGGPPVTSFPTELPRPRVPDSNDAPPLRWGILGTGWIAERFVASLQAHTRQQVVAIGSRNSATAQTFADRFGVSRAHGFYEQLVADPDVDVVYVATPHNLHHPHALLAIEAGKHVLVEKPIGINAAQAREIGDAAQRHGVFCAEALWTFFLPRFDVVRQVLDDGVLGEVRTVIADHGEWFPPTHRIFRHDLAGGPLLDLATYTAAMAVAVLGPPEQVLAIRSDAPTGVHGQVSAVLRHAHGSQSLLSTTLFSNTPTGAVLAGTEATLMLPGPFFAPGDVELLSFERTRRLRYSEPAVLHDAMHHQAAEAALRIAAGETSTPVRPLADTITTLEVLDAIRREIGVTYLEESAPGVPA
jgi:predicted dehydrogenase